MGSFRLPKFQDDILSTIDKNGLSDNIKWVAQIPHQDVWTYLNKTAVGVIPFRKNSLTMNNTKDRMSGTAVNKAGKVEKILATQIK